MQTNATTIKTIKSPAKLAKQANSTLKYKDNKKHRPVPLKRVVNHASS